ncbi:MAG: secretin N-terminal domain-containing protein [Candidatus Omnitrophica bacterium]|nr:secretin N-terminal domain-containing protein [Candidatus Omnitrophota bacterium]
MKNIKKVNVWKIVLLLPLVLCMHPPAYTQAPQGEVKNEVVAKDEGGQLRVDLDVKDADIRDVARAFARISGMNIIVSDEVRATVSLRVQSTDWREALTMILQANNLTMYEGENYLVITTFDRRRQVEESGALQTKVVSFNFVDVNEMKKSLESMLTARGKIEIDARTNSLVITDIPDRIAKVEQVAKALDTKTPQVMIETMMLTVKLTDDDQLGVEWTLTEKDESNRVINQALSLGSGTRTGYLKYGKTLFPWSYFTGLIDFWVRNQKADILANPRVLTLDNMPATIDLTEQVAYTETTQSTESTSVLQSTQFKDVPVKLVVKPHITKDDYVFMNIVTEQSFRSGTSGGQPIIDKRSASTNLMVKDGETIVIGGLRKKEKTSTIDKFPLLGDIPFVGFLFRKTVINTVNTELIIFVTPHVIKDTKMSPIETKYLEEFNKITAGKTQEAFKNANPFPLRAPVAKTSQ